MGDPTQDNVRADDGRPEDTGYQKREDLVDIHDRAMSNRASTHPRPRRRSSPILASRWQPWQVGGGREDGKLGDVSDTFSRRLGAVSVELPLVLDYSNTILLSTASPELGMQRISHAAEECLPLLYLACSHLSWACFCTPKVLNCSYSAPRSAQMRAAAGLGR